MMPETLLQKASRLVNELHSLSGVVEKMPSEHKTAINEQVQSVMAMIDKLVIDGNTNRIDALLNQRLAGITQCIEDVRNFAKDVHADFAQRN